MKFFNEAKGFGFILDIVRGEEFFVRGIEIKDSSRAMEGDAFEFEVAKGKKYPEAVYLYKIPLPVEIIKQSNAKILA